MYLIKQEEFTSLIISSKVTKIFNEANNNNNNHYGTCTLVNATKRERERERGSRGGKQQDGR